jgi:hypothetical protein
MQLCAWSFGENIPNNERVNNTAENYLSPARGTTRA